MSANTDLYTKQAALLVSRLGLPGNSTIVNNIAQLLRSGQTDKTKRDSNIKHLENADPRLYTTVKSLSDDLQTVETLLRTVVSPDTPNDDVQFYSRLVNDPLYQLELIDDFINATTETGEIGTLGWSFASAGTAGAVNNLNAVRRHPGIIEIVTGNTSGSIESVFLGGAAADLVINFDDILRMIGIVRIPTPITSMKTRFGAFKSAIGTGAAITDGAYWEYTSSDGLWHGVCRVGSVETRINGPAAVADQWEKLEIYQLLDGTVDFFISDKNIGNISTNLPTNVGLNVAYAAEVTSANARDFDFDYFRLTGPLLPYNERFT